MVEYLLNVEETLLEDETKILQDCVKEQLEITLVSQTPYPGLLFGRILECSTIQDIIPRMVSMVVRTFQRMEPRPTVARLSLHKAKGDGKYLVRLAVPKIEKIKDRCLS